MKKNIFIGILITTLILSSVFVYASTAMPFMKDSSFTATGHFITQAGSFGSAIFDKSTLKVQESSSLAIKDMKSLKDQNIEQTERGICLAAGSLTRFYVINQHVTLERLDLVKDLDGQALINNNGKEFTKSTLGKDPVLENLLFNEILTVPPGPDHNYAATFTGDFKFDSGLRYRCDNQGNSQYEFKAKIKREETYICERISDSTKLFERTITSEALLKTDAITIPCATVVVDIPASTSISGDH